MQDRKSYYEVENGVTTWGRPKSALCAFPKPHPTKIGVYVRGWEIQQVIEDHPDYGKVLAEVRTKAEAQQIIDTQQLPEKGVNRNEH